MTTASRVRAVPVLLAGGAGARLWPLSRDGLPKQFQPLAGTRSTYQQALARVSDPDLFAPPVVVTNEAFRFFALEQAADMGLSPTILLEPARRDSAPAIAAGAAFAAREDPSAVVLAIAADHVILDADLFLSATQSAVAATEQWIVTFGIRPTEPKTAYGYIRRGAALDVPGVFAVEAFVEKPDAVTAAGYVAAGYLWNSGNFVFRADRLAEELARHAPDVAVAAATAVKRASVDRAFVRLDPEAFARAPKISFDFALMEKTRAAAVVEARFRWSDIGSWDSVLGISERDAAGNAVAGDAELLDARGCLVHAETGLAALVGVENLVVVTTPDAVLVAHRERAEDVKALVARLEARGRPEASQHRKGYRPWGHYDRVDRGERFQVKRLVVKPGAAVSLQKHLHRAEHWVVVRGTAEVALDGKTIHLHENESTFIPAGAVHRLANPGKIPLEIIEVQTGSYLGEDDIVRFEDVYARM